MTEITLSGEEIVRTVTQLLPKYVCKKFLILRQTLEFLRTKDFTRTFEKTFHQFDHWTTIFCAFLVY